MSFEESSERALLLAPVGRDASVAASILAEASIASHAHESVADLVEGFNKGVGFVVATEEALTSSDIKPLADWLGAQQEWSDLPFILLTHRGGGLERNPAAARYLGLLGNVTFLERPFHPTTLVSLAQSALRARRRQYEARVRLRELRHSAERYRSLFSSIDAGFCIIDLLFDENGRGCDYRFVEVNPAFVHQTGLEDAIGRTIRELNPVHEQHWFDIYGEIAKTGEAQRFEHVAKGLGRWYDVYAFRVGDPALRRVAVLFNDISARRAMEEELRDLTTSLERRVETATAEREQALAQLHEAQKLETLGQLTGGVAHDFNNLLMPIMGVLELINRRYGADDERAAKLIGGALESADRARLLVQRLLGFARRQALQTRPVDLLSLLEGMRDLIASSIGPEIEMTLRGEPNLPPALVDPNQLELAVLNLAVNARDAMPAGGSLSLCVEAGDPAQLASLAPGRYLRLSVSDSGIGMDPDTLTRAIEPFYSTKGIGKGTGLGLSMVHGLASQLGGGFRLTSAPGEGTRVDLWLPAAEVAATAVHGEVAGDEPKRPAAAASILLVDDEQLVRTATSEMLRELGHVVTEAADGPEALAALEERAPDLLITDYKMPRMDGMELARQANRLWPAMPVLLITGYSGPAAESDGLPRLDKPFRRADLARAIEQALGGA